MYLSSERFMLPSSTTRTSVIYSPFMPQRRHVPRSPVYPAAGVQAPQKPTYLATRFQLLDTMKPDPCRVKAGSQ